MRSVFGNFGVFIGLGVIGLLVVIAGPYLMNERCKDRWPPRFEPYWTFRHGCMLRIGNTLVPEGQVFISR